MDEVTMAARESLHHTRLSDCCDLQAGPSGQLVPAADRSTSGVPLLRPHNVGLDREVRRDNLTFVTEEKAAQLSRYRLWAGDIVCVRTGHPGRPALVSKAEQGWLYTGNLFRLRPNDRVDAGYLVQYLASPLVEQWFEAHVRQGVGIPSISIRDLAALPVPVPPIAEQHRIGMELAALDEKIIAHSEIVRVSRELRRSLSALMFEEPR